MLESFCSYYYNNYCILFFNRRFFEWAFIRHHNILSWYIRPLFIILIILGALKKSYAIIFVTIFCLFTSMFWFPEPKKVNESVIKFLDFEKNYLTNGWTVDKIFVLLAILLFLSFYFIQPGIEIGNIYYSLLYLVLY